MVRRGREFWTAAIAELERSELTHRQFARRRGVPVETLRSWIYRLRREPQVSVPLLPVRIASRPTADRSASTDVKTIELMSPSGVRVRFEVGADIEYVAALVRQLG